MGALHQAGPSSSAGTVRQLTGWLPSAVLLVPFLAYSTLQRLATYIASSQEHFAANCKLVSEDLSVLYEVFAPTMQGKIKSLEQIYLFSMPVKEYQIVENFLGSALKDEVMKIMPVQKQTRAGQRTRFKAFVVVGDHAGHVGLGVKCAKEVSQSA